MALLCAGYDDARDGFDHGADRGIWQRLGNVLWRVDPQTGQTYYGRGFVQLTWRDNYARADAEIPLIDEDSVRVACAICA